MTNLLSQITNVSFAVKGWSSFSRDENVVNILIVMWRQIFTVWLREPGNDCTPPKAPPPSGPYTRRAYPAVMSRKSCQLGYFCTCWRRLYMVASQDFPNSAMAKPAPGDVSRAPKSMEYITSGRTAREWHCKNLSPLGEKMFAIFISGKFVISDDRIVK